MPLGPSVLSDSGIEYQAIIAQRDARGLQSMDLDIPGPG